MAALAELGPRRLSVAEIARRAEVSRMTVYRRYGSLERLVSAALTAEFADLLARASAEATEDNGRRRVVRQTLATISALLDHSLLREVLETDPATVLPLLVERIGAGQQLLLDHLAALIREGMADGSVRSGDPDLMALTVLAMGQTFATGMRPFEQRYPRQALLGELGRAIDRYLEVPHDQAG